MGWDGAMVHGIMDDEIANRMDFFNEWAITYFLITCY